MSLNAQRRLAIAVAVLSAGLGVLQVADPADFGLTPVMIRWLGVLTAMLAVLAGLLPRIQGPTADPETLTERVWSLPPNERKMVARNLADRASREQRVRVVGFFDSGSPVPVPDEERHAQ